MIYLIVLGFGLFSLLRIKLDLYPELSFPVVVVMTNYVGAGPKDVENLVTRVVEEAVSAVEGVEEVSSSSQYSNSVVQIKFSWSTDMDEAERKVQKYLDMYAKPALPEDVTDPLAFAFNPSMQPILFFIVKGKNKNLAELRKISEDYLEPLLERVDGVAQAITMGGPKRQINIKLNPYKLESLNISINQVTNAIRAANILVPGGSVISSLTDYNIMTKGDFATIEEINKTPIVTKGTKMITVRDVATVEDGFREDKNVSRHNKKDCVLLLMRRQSDANTVRTVENIMKSIDNFKQKNLIPADIELPVLFNQAEMVNLSLGNLTSTGWQALLITLIVLLLFTSSLRSSLIVAVSIPVSVIATFGVMDEANITLNMISMAGLALAIGMLVDNIMSQDKRIAEPPMFHS